MTRRSPRRLARTALVAVFALCMAVSSVAQQHKHERKWLPIARDGVHDPKSPAAKQLQEPGEALSALAPDTAGNQVRWMEALSKGQITPRANVNPDPRAAELRETEIFLNLKGGTPIVRFPHKQHTMWLDCSNCHDGLFKRQVGGTELNMRRMLQGEQCGLCHGAVAFPLTECNRCHNTSRIGFVKPGSAAPGSDAALAPPAPGRRP